MVVRQEYTIEKSQKALHTRTLNECRESGKTPSTLTWKEIKRILNNWELYNVKMYKYPLPVIDTLTLIMKFFNTTKLPAKQQLITGYWMKGYNENEIAKTCNVTQQNVHKTLHTTCEKIRRYIEKRRK